MTYWVLVWYLAAWPSLGGEIPYGPMRADCHAQVGVLRAFDPWIVALCAPEFVAPGWESD